MGFVLALVSSAAFGLIPLFSLPLLRSGLSADCVLFYRFLFAALSLGIILVLRRERLAAPLHELGKLALFSILYALAALLMIWGLLYLPGGATATLQFLYPLMVMLIMTIFFHEKFSIITASSVLLAILGVALLGSGGGDGGGEIGQVGIVDAVAAYALALGPFAAQTGILAQAVGEVESCVRSERNIRLARNHDFHSDSALYCPFDGFPNASRRCEVRIDQLNFTVGRINGGNIGFPHSLGSFFGNSLYDSHPSSAYVRKMCQGIFVQRETFFSTDMLSGFLVPGMQKGFLQIFGGRPFDAYMHITPGTDFRQSIDVIVGNIHTARITNLPIHYYYFLMIPAEYMVDIRKTERVELYNFNSAFVQHL